MEFFVITMIVALLTVIKATGLSMECPLMYRAVGLVCGTDGVTYPSLCELEVARLFDNALDIAYFGVCTTYCKKVWEPVCGNDLVTYENLCMFEVSARKHSELDILHMGQCRKGDEEYIEGYDKKKRYAKILQHLTQLLTVTENVDLNKKEPTTPLSDNRNSGHKKLRTFE